MEKEDIVNKLDELISEAEIRAHDKALYWVLNNCHLSEEDHELVFSQIEYPCYD